MQRNERLRRGSFSCTYHCIQWRNIEAYKTGWQPFSPTFSVSLPLIVLFFFFFRPREVVQSLLSPHHLPRPHTSYHLFLTCTPRPLSLKLLIQGPLSQLFWLGLVSPNQMVSHVKSENSTLAISSVSSSCSS